MRISDMQRERIISLQDAWRDAEKTYSGEARKYSRGWWIGDGPPPDDIWPEPVTSAALGTLRELRERADAARAALHDYLTTLE